MPQNSTPPRPHTQSPIINMPSHPMQMQHGNSPYTLPITQPTQQPPRTITGNSYLSSYID